MSTFGRRSQTMSILSSFDVLFGIVDGVDFGW